MEQGPSRSANQKRAECLGELPGCYPQVSRFPAGSPLRPRQMRLNSRHCSPRRHSGVRLWVPFQCRMQDETSAPESDLGRSFIQQLRSLAKWIGFPEWIARMEITLNQLSSSGPLLRRPAKHELTPATTRVTLPMLIIRAIEPPQPVVDHQSHDAQISRLPNADATSNL